MSAPTTRHIPPLWSNALHNHPDRCIVAAGPIRWGEGEDPSRIVLVDLGTQYIVWAQSWPTADVAKPLDHGAMFLGDYRSGLDAATARFIERVSRHHDA